MEVYGIFVVPNFARIRLSFFFFHPEESNVFSLDVFLLLVSPDIGPKFWIFSYVVKLFPGSVLLFTSAAELFQSL